MPPAARKKPVAKKATDPGCPHCGAPGSEMCTDPRGKPVNDHAARTRLIEKTPVVKKKVPAKKKPVAKTPAAAAKAVVLRTEEVSVLDLVGFHKNARIGDVGAIAASLEANGQYKPIVVNVGTYTGRPNEVLAGNHTWMGARHAGWDSILVSFVDVDDERAVNIVVADNKTAELGTYDADILAELVSGLPTLEGTGFTTGEVDALLDAVASDVEDVMREFNKSTEDDRAKLREERKKDSFMGSDFGTETEDQLEEEDDDPDDDDPTFDDESDQLPGAMSFKAPNEVPKYEGIGPWDIPALNPDMLVTPKDLPDLIHTWAGSATAMKERENIADLSDDEYDDVTWLYNYGIDSTSGMQDPSQMIMSFYCYDHYFEKWWSYPERFAAKMYNTGITMMVSHDFTPGGQLDPRAEALWAIFKSRWLARYFQDCGFKVIPNITWRDGDRKFLDNEVLKTLPKETSVIAMQLQTLDPDKVAGGVDGYKADILHVFKVLQPEVAILYVGQQVKKMIDAGELEFPCKTIVLTARQHYLSEKAKRREKKAGF